MNPEPPTLNPATPPSAADLQPDHWALGAVPLAWLAERSAEEGVEAVNLRNRICALVEGRGDDRENPVYPHFERAEWREIWNGIYAEAARDQDAERGRRGDTETGEASPHLPLSASPRLLKALRSAEALLTRRASERALMLDDPFHHGHVADAWEEILWEICALRVRNPGVPIEFLITGGNGGGKSVLCAWLIMMFLTRMEDMLVWDYAMDQKSSQTTMQQKVYFYLPNEYKTESGSLGKRHAKAKLGWNNDTGFSNDSFGLHNGARIQFRFWTQEGATTEGPRPALAHSDEMIPKKWKDDITARLMTYAGPTRKDVPMWKHLLERRAAGEPGTLNPEPGMKFPRHLLGRLLMGVHLISFTPKDGARTDVVKEFQDGATTLRSIDATLLPIKDADGTITGYEKMPKLLRCKRQDQGCYFLHAWDNVWGGNWEGYQKAAALYTRQEILWRIYGIAEALIGSPFPMFSRAAHVRPWEMFWKAEEQEAA